MTEDNRMPYDVQRGPREQLIAALTEFADHRGEQGKTERAEGARRAAAQLAAGADVVHFERTYYEVGDAKRHGVIRRTREDAIAELHDASEGWWHNGKEPLDFEARAAAARIAAGADSVEVGHLVWEVIDTPTAERTVSGTRAQIVQALHDAGKWGARFDRGTEVAARAAVAQIEQGANRTRVGHTEYEVTEED